MHEILQEIEKEPNAVLYDLLPSFRVLRERRWNKPLIFIYSGNAWPLAMFPWRLREVSRTAFPVPECRQWCYNAPYGMQDDIRKQIVCGFRYDLVGTLFVVERYQAFLLTEKEEHTPLINMRFNHPVSSSIVRISVNDGEKAECEQEDINTITKCDDDRLRVVFFGSATPLLDGSTKQLEVQWANSATRFSLNSGRNSGSSAESSLQDSFAKLDVKEMSFEKNSHDFLFLPDPSTRNASRSEEEFVSNSLLNAVRKASVPRRISNIVNLFDQEDRYLIDVTRAWARWTNKWEDIKRSDVVNSIDEILTSLKGSREAVHVAVAYLDAFLSASPKVVHDPTYFTGVILACSMLGCKQVDRFFPPIRLFLRCKHPDFQINTREFCSYERHVLETLSFRLHPLTLLDVVETLLALCAGAGGPRWGAVCAAARLLTDLVLRSARARGFRPTALGAAVLAVAAARARWPLPAGLAGLLPDAAGPPRPPRHDEPAPATASATDESDEKLIALFAQMARARDGQMGSAAIPAAVEVVRECCREFEQNGVEGVLARRYKVQDGRLTPYEFGKEGEKAEEGVKGVSSFEDREKDCEVGE